MRQKKPKWIHLLSPFSDFMILFVCLFSFAGKPCSCAEPVLAEKLKIAGVYFYGYQGLNLEEIEQAFPLKAAALVSEAEWFGGQRARLIESVRKIAGEPATDLALVNTEQGSIVFVGIPAKSNWKQPAFNKLAASRVEAPQEVKMAYEQLMDLLPKAVANKQKEDLQTYLAKKKELIEIASGKRTALLAALSSSSDNDRIVSSYALGLVAESKEELSALVGLSMDPNNTVRNNSTRQLAELLYQRPELASRIPAKTYIAMLNSPIWTDRNKASFLLDGLTRTRNPEILAELRRNALPALKEMCKWPSGYRELAIELLGRIAGIPEKKLKDLRDASNSAEVIEMLEKNQ